MALFRGQPQSHPLFTVLFLLVVCLALPFNAALGRSNGSATTIEPSLGWLGGEPGSLSLRSLEACNSAQLKRGSLAKVGRHLAALFCNPEERVSSALTAIVGAGEEQLVTIDTAATGDPQALADQLRALGARSISVYGPVVSAQFPIARIDALAALSDLRLARPASAVVHTGSVTGQHVAALEVAGLAASGLDGTGVSIGVLSDSFDCLGGAATDIATADLPAGAVALLDEAGCASGTDEGRAMMQLIHDVVPGASQAFHTAFGGQATFANGIQALETSGASVIVDDVTYFAEPMFQDGIIAQAVDGVATSNNVAYFSSAGNSDNNSYESNFDDSGSAGPFSGPLHDFDPGAGVDTLQQITVPTGDTVVILNWDQPYFSATGGAGSVSDLDIHVYNGATYLFSAATDNLGADPIEILSITNTGAPMSVNLAIEYFDGPGWPTPIPTFVKYVIMNDTTIDEYATGSGTSFGHANTDGAITVGAANYWQTPAFGVDPALVAGYSSHGGVPILFNLADLPVGPLDRGKPEIVGPDGANTTFFGADIAHATDPDTFPNFFGTSASAPALAAIGAMMQQTRPTITPTEVESCLTGTAADMGAAGYDAETGNGWVQAEAALICSNGDWGDLPDSFGTSSANGGATHGLIVASFLGASVDNEVDGVPDNAAGSDDATGADEDGIVFLDPLVPLRQARIQVTASDAGYLNAWIDFDGDLSFSTGERIRNDAAIPAGTSTFQFGVPFGASGVMYSRFRYTIDDPGGALGATGAWLNGEVEDYALASLGNRVWNDDGSGGGVSGDGLQNGSEAGVAGVNVYLLDGAGVGINDAQAIPIDALTDTDGLYELPGLPPGSYRLEFSLPGGAAGFSPADAGDDALDSDPNIITGRTATSVLAAGQIDDTVDAGTQLATLALISRVSARREGRGVVVEWETASEAGTIGFEVFRRDPGNGWQRVNSQPVAALLGAPQGGTYALRDTEAPGEATQLEYALAEIESGGRLRFYGPFAVALTDADAESLVSDFGVGRAHQRTQLRQSEQTAEASAGSKVELSSLSRGAGVAKLGIDRTGLVAVSATDLARALARPQREVRAAIRRHALRFTVNGREVPWYADQLRDTAVFYGEHQPSLYARDTFYRVEFGVRGLAMASNDKPAPPPTGSGWFDERLPYEEDLLPAIAATEETGADFWHWGGVIAGHATHGSADFELAVPGLVVAGAPQLTVRLVGGSRGPALDEHWAEVRVNGEPAGRVRWDDKDRVSATFDVDPTWLSAETTVTVEALADDDSGFSLFFIEGFELTYRRALEAQADRLRFVVGTSGVASVDGFSGPDLVAVDVTDPQAPRVLTGLAVDGGPIFRGTIAAPSGRLIEMVRHGVLAAGTGLKAVARPRLTIHSGAEYLIVAPRELLAPAQDLADYRRADGLSTQVVRLEQLYDEFSDSQPTPWAVRNFLEVAVREWSIAPRYLLLAGAGTFDPRDLLGTGDNLLAPVLMGTPHGLAASDNLLADLTGDGIADLAVGRLPVLTVGEFEAYIEKVRGFESADGEWRREALLLADDADAAGDFDAASEEAASDLPPDFDLERVYLSQLDIGPARQETIKRWREGALLVNYFGHGGVTQLAAEGLLTNDDVEALDSGPRSPILVAMTCVVGRFELPGFDSLGERLVLRPDGGAIAVWAPTSLSSTGLGRALSTEFYRRLLGRDRDVRLGDAARMALEAVGGGGDPAQVLTTHTLLGDPALRVVSY